MNPYDILGVRADASDEEIARAYKRLAKRYHPDLNPGNAQAAERMGQINRAYDDIKAMRQRGMGPDGSPGPGPGTAYRGPFDPFAAGQSYYYTYQSYRPRRNPMGMILAVLVMIFVIRLLLSILLGGFGGYYYVSPGFGSGPGGYYGYSQSFPGDWITGD